ncbi:hypothetical protein [Enterobacter ludwigii]|uniref:hypothetical protein n=1 Tax=Enterobacter ludwigii TaxID=299767 RepID=UPI003974C16B
MRVLIVFLSVVFLSGCVEYRWDKPGASKQDLEADRMSCRAEALKAMPPDNIISGTHAGVHTEKYKKEKVADIKFDVRDLNAENRKVLVRDCLYRKGWSIIEVQR